jgi:hypothetical protein
MQKLGGLGKLKRRSFWLWPLAAVLLAGLFFYRLGNLTAGLSLSELKSAALPLGLHNIYRSPLYLPLKLARTLVFFVFPEHGQLLSRLPNALFGLATVIVFAFLIRLWHGRQIAVLAGFMFAASAWTLHVSRIVGFEVLYLWAMPTLLLAYLLLQKYPRPSLWYLTAILNGLLLYVPGLVWLVILNAYLQRELLTGAWRQFNGFWQRLFYFLGHLIWLPLLLVDLTRPGQLKLWLGLPTHFSSLTHSLKDIVAVPVHLFIRGPQYPEIWLGRAPILDLFTLAAALIGIYFYFSRWPSARGRLLAAFFILGWIEVGLSGPVGLSLLVPLLYTTAATGLAYLFRDWIKVFPRNPLARGLCLGLLSVAVALSCLYNLRAYFIAWPHNSVTRQTFNHRL